MGGGIRMKWLAALLAMILSVPAAAEMLVIAHRGASGERPEHTLAAYQLAIEQGADYIEPDLVMTKDGVFVARHENEISETTDVAQRAEFADRKATRLIDGQEVTGWFTEDFTLAELKSLRAKERLPELRPQNTTYDGLYEIPALAEIISLIREHEAALGRRIGLYPEIKHPAYFEALGFDMMRQLIDELEEAGYRDGRDPAFIQSFEVTPLATGREHTQLRLVQLLAPGGGPADIEGGSYAEMATPEGLRRIATYADAIGAEIGMILNPDGSPTKLVANARAAGLDIHAWTLRRENAFLPAPLRRGDDPAEAGDMARLWRLLEAAGVDGVFTDNPGDVPGRPDQLR